MKRSTSSRRRFCREIAWAGALAPLSSSFAIGPIKRTGSPRLKLSLAAYSFRKQLTAKPGTPGAMDMMGFIDWCATQDLDGFEPTSYFFPKEITPGYLAQMKRKAHLHGLDVSSGAIRNVFTLPDGPELKKWHDHGNFIDKDGYEAFERTAPYAATVQLKVELRDESGKKVPADMNRLIGILKKANYRGYVVLEYEANEDPFTAIPRHLKELRELIG
jgi:hypothetical protein